MQRTSREQVLDAVADSVRDLGARRTTMAEVARRAGLSRSTVYTHFPDVTAAIAALLTRELLALAEEAAAAGEGRTARQRIVARAVHMARCVPDHPLVERLLDLDAELLMPYLVSRLGSSQRAILGALAAEVGAGQADGSVRSGPPDLLAFSVFLVVQSFVTSARIAATEHGREAVLAELALVVDRALAPEPAAPEGAVP